MDCLEQDAPATMKMVSRKMRDTAGGTPALPFEEAASSFYSSMTNDY